jgi:hypothetical protein
MERIEYYSLQPIDDVLLKPLSDAGPFPEMGSISLLECTCWSDICGSRAKTTPNLTVMRHQNDRDASVQALNDRICWRGAERYDFDRGPIIAITIRIYVKNTCLSAVIR